MGCDVTAFAEIRLEDRWEHAGSVNINRCYVGFGFMVNGHARAAYIKGVANERGLPKDINPYTKKMIEAFCCHTYSWLTYRECETVNELCREHDDSMTNYNLIPVHKDDFPVRLKEDNFRLVFGFDS